MRLRSTMIVWVSFAAAAMPLLAGAPAYAHSGTAGNDTRCFVVLEKLRPGETVSRVKSQECVSGDERRRTMAGTLLMTWYQHANFNQDQSGTSTAIEGGAGPCDTAGYGIRNVDYYWRESLSSYKVWNSCWHSRLYTGLNYGGTPSGVFSGHVGYVGNVHNDHVWSMLVWAAG